MVNKPKEKYLGDAEDRKYIKSYLATLRSLTPKEMFLLEGAQPLSVLLSRKGSLDRELFVEMSTKALAILREEYDGSIELLSRDRAFFAPPRASDNIGGFHSAHAVGYQNMYQASFSVLPDKKVRNQAVRTFEVLRCYLHDTLHHSTFCSYRRATRRPSTGRDAKHLLPSIYRFQYGFNFRNAAGHSYSSAALTYKAPYSINLNLLMDGSIVITVAEVMSRFAQSVDRSNLSKAELAVIDDVILASDYRKPTVYGEEFYYKVTSPAQKFLAYWGGDHMRRLVIQAMVTGEMERLVSFFDERSGERGSWERYFKQPDFEMDIVS